MDPPHFTRLQSRDTYPALHPHSVPKLCFLVLTSLPCPLPRWTLQSFWSWLPLYHSFLVFFLPVIISLRFSSRAQAQAHTLLLFLIFYLLPISLLTLYAPFGQTCQLLWIHESMWALDWWPVSSPELQIYRHLLGMPTGCKATVPAAFHGIPHLRVWITIYTSALVWNPLTNPTCTHYSFLYSFIVSPICLLLVNSTATALLNPFLEDCLVS